MQIPGEEDRLLRLHELGLATITGFEPLPEEFAKLESQSGTGRRYLPYAIGDGTRRTLFVTNTAMTSSLLRPNQRFVGLFVKLAELMQVVRNVEVDTRRLDDIPELRPDGCDLLKLDTQGSEHEILANAPQLLANCLIVQTEVEFAPLYEQQPLFADVDALLRRAGFMLHRFLGLSGRPYHPWVVNNDPYQAISQVLWADAVYVPDVLRLAAYEPAALLKLAAMLHEIYGSFDLCHFVLAAHDRKVPGDVAERYRQRLLREPGEARPL
jgi:FkbM family methyltransferase